MAKRKEDKEKKKAENLDEILMIRFGELELNFENSIEDVNVITKNVEIGEDNYFQKSLVPKDFLYPKDSKGVIGTTLMNFVNKTKKIIKILNKEKNKARQMDKNEFILVKSVSTLKRRLLTEFSSVVELQVLTSSILRNFIFEFKKEFKEENLYKYIQKCKNNSSNSYFYKFMFDYLSSIEDKRFYNKYHWYDAFSEQGVYLAFIAYLSFSTNFIKNNITKDIEIPNYAKVDKLEIKDFLHLFYISKYQLEKHKKLIKKCKNCHTYFITKSRRSETYCLRKYKRNGMTCHEFASDSYRKTENISANISKEINSIKALIRKRILLNTFAEEQLPLFQKKLENKKNEMGIEPKYGDNSDKDNKEFLDWLKGIHRDLKKGIIVDISKIKIQ